jgi:hypothetical protein
MMNWNLFFKETVEFHRKETAESLVVKAQNFLLKVNLITTLYMSKRIHC